MRFQIEEVLAQAPLKPKKKEVLRQVQKCLEEEEVPQEALAELIGICLRYFESWPARKASSDDFAWTALASSSDSTKISLVQPWTTEEYLYASDGHRLHATPINGLKPKKVYDKQHRVVLPDPAVPPPVVEYFRENFFRKGERKVVLRKDFVDVDETAVRYEKTQFMKKYLNDILVSPDTAFDMWITDSPFEVVFFETSGRQAWLMPMDPSKRQR
jgi:hypothetical protein